MVLKDVMTRHVQTVGSGQSIKEAAMLMRDLDVGILPVQDGNKLVGTVTDRDITLRAIANGDDPDKTRVQEVMTKGVVSAYEDDDTEVAVEAMEENKVRRLIVLDRGNQCVGIVSLGDIALRIGDPTMSEELLEEVSRPSA